MRKLILAMFFVLGCGGSGESRSADLTVHYFGKQVHKVSTKYKTLQQVKTSLEKKQDKYIIFMADWCKSCDFLLKALKQSGHFEKVMLIDIDEAWVQAIASEMDVTAVPTMIKIDKKDKITQIIVGPSKITMYLLINVE